jgi:hypothetical protein
MRFLSKTKKMNTKQKITLAILLLIGSRLIINQIINNFNFVL